MNCESDREFEEFFFYIFFVDRSVKVNRYLSIDIKLFLMLIFMCSLEDGKGNFRDC